MDSIGWKIELLLVLGSLALGGPSAAEKLSAAQKAPQFANSSAGRSLALPRDDDDHDDLAEGQSRGSGLLGQVLAGLHIKASGQTPADTSLLPPAASRRSGSADVLERLHIKASGQTPADTSLLPAAKIAHGSEQRSPSSQSRRAGQGPAHVTLIGPEQAKAAGRQTPANVGLLSPGGPRPAPAAGGARQQDAVQREEMTSFKEVNGESIRVVVGNYGYASPEGLPISFKYMSDENGNQASFSIGTPGAGAGSSSRPAGGTGAGAGGSSSRPGGAGAGAGRGTSGAGKTGGATGAGAGGDRKYLPPN